MIGEASSNNRVPYQGKSVASFTTDAREAQDELRQLSKESTEGNSTEWQMTIQAKFHAGHWTAHYINRDGGWSVACDALGHVIRCETENLGLSVARHRRRRLQPF